MFDGLFTMKLLFIEVLSFFVQVLTYLFLTPADIMLDNVYVLAHIAIVCDNCEFYSDSFPTCNIGFIISIFSYILRIPNAHWKPNILFICNTAL